MNQVPFKVTIHSTVVSLCQGPFQCGGCTMVSTVALPGSCRLVHSGSAGGAMGSSSNLLSSQRVAAAPSPSRPWPQTPRSARQRLRQRAPRQSSQHRLETVDKRDAHGRFPERLALSRWSPSQIALAEQLAAQASAASFSPTKKPAALYARRALLRHKLKTGGSLSSATAPCR